MIENNEQFNNDLEFCDKLFEKFAAPQISSQTLDSIKRNIEAKLSCRHRHILPLRFRILSAAAVVLIACGIFFALNRHSNTPDITAAKLTGIENFEQAHQKNINSVQSQIDDIQKELTAITLGLDIDDDNILQETIDCTEIEIIENENNFWKG